MRCSGATAGNGSSGGIQMGSTPCWSPAGAQSGEAQEEGIERGCGIGPMGNFGERRWVDWEGSR